jgi:hypothetical protein
MPVKCVASHICRVNTYVYPRSSDILELKTWLSYHSCGIIQTDGSWRGSDGEHKGSSQKTHPPQTPHCMITPHRSSRILTSLTGKPGLGIAQYFSRWDHANHLDGTIVFVNETTCRSRKIVGRFDQHKYRLHPV